MGAHGLLWVHIDLSMQRQAKTRQKEQEMTDQDMFRHAWSVATINRNSATKEFGVGKGEYGCKWS